MRNLPFIAALVVILLYLSLSWLSWISLRRLIHKPSYTTWFNRLFIAFTALQALTFTALFIYPFTAATATYYPVYFVYNSILITDIFMKIPMAIAATGIFIARRDSVRFVLSFGSLLISAGISLAFAWAFTLGPRTLQKNQIELHFSHLPESFDGYRVAVLSDFHLGNFHYKGLFEKCIRSCDEFNPDIILFTGDLVNNFAEEINGWEPWFNRLHASDGKFAVLGNHDYGYYFRWPSALEKKQNFDNIQQSLRDLGFEILANSSVAVTRGNDSVYIIGVENWGHPPFPQYGDLEKAGRQIPLSAFKILMSHDPAHWEERVKYMDHFPLTFSGHTHGFQWGIKLAGFEFSIAGLAREHWGGLYNYNGNFLYVNKGIGTIGLPLRLDMPAEITFVTLKKR